MFPLRPIKNDDELDSAIKSINELLDIEYLSEEQQDYLHVLALIVHDYEHREHPIEPPTFIELLRHFMEDRRINQTELSRGTGIPKSIICDLLSGKRQPTKNIKTKLALYFHVHVGTFD